MRRFALAVLTAILAVPGWAVAAGSGAAAPEADAAFAARFAALALECAHKEYPNKISHVLSGDADVRPPRELTPAFFGCFDWHSSVHGHWLLARLARTFPEAEFAPAARAALARSLTPENLQAEVRYLEGEGRVSFERPYGLAWLLQLATELREWEDEEARRWAGALRPLEKAARDRLADWLPKLTYAIRYGEHSQTAFAFGLILDWARASGDREMESLLVSRIRDYHLKDRDCPLAYEPSGQDFLSPCLAEADLMRRILGGAEYAAWLGVFLPGIPLDGSSAWLEPAIVSDPGDPKLAHLDGLNLSRAWMLEGIAAGLPSSDPRLPAIRGAARLHRERGLAAVTGEHYEGGHWLGSFATYLVTGRGLPAAIQSTSPPASTPAGTSEGPAIPASTQASPPNIPLDGRGGGLIAFYSERDGNAEIYVMNADGSAETRLTRHPGADVAPDLSPDGSRILFVSNRDGIDQIYRMNVDGTDLVRLTNTRAKESYPYWSSDGARIIFCSRRNGDTYEIYLMNPDGTDPTRLTSNFLNEEWACLSGDMKRIVCAVGSFPRYDLHVMNVDGSDHRVLLRSDRIAALPKWSRDGRRIAYNHAAFSSRRTTGDIRLLNDDGSDVRQITESRGDSVSENPYWSPDGRRIAFQSNRTGNFQIYVMNADGTGPVRLTKHPGNDYWPSWSRAPASGAPRR